MSARPPDLADPVPPFPAGPPLPGSPEAAETGRTAEAMLRLAPTLDAFVRAHDEPPFPPFRPAPGSVTTGALPDTGIGLDAMIDELALAVADGSRISAPGFLGFITTGASTGPAVALAATAVAGGQRYTLHSFNSLEHTGLRWLAELCGLPEGVAGVFSSGGSTANLVGLGAARQAAFERHGVDVAEDGMPAGLRGRIYASTLAHRTIHRAAAVLGLGRGSRRRHPRRPGRAHPTRRARGRHGRGRPPRDPAHRRGGDRGCDRHGLGGPHRRRDRRSPGATAAGCTSTGPMGWSPTHRRCSRPCSRASARRTPGSWTRTSGWRPAWASAPPSSGTRAC